MMLTRFLTLLWIATALSGCVHLSSVQEFPPQFADRFERHNMWLSITFFRSNAELRPTFDFIVTKKWEVKELENGRRYLENFTTTSPAGMSELLKKGTLGFFPDAGVPGQIFLPTTYSVVDAVEPWGRDEYTFRDLDGTRFEISINGDQGRIVFVPAPNNYHTAADLYDGKPVGIWTTPFGSSSEVVYDIGERTTDPDSREQFEDFIEKAGTRYYLHHDAGINRRIVVTIDKSVPRQYIIPLNNAVNEWNKAVGKQLLHLKVSQEDINFSDCMSSRILCIKWHGDILFPYTGLTAFTEMAHDPQSGLITGGLITVINEVDSSLLKHMSAEQKAKIIRDDIDMKFVAEAMVNSSNYVDVAHPSPNALVERVFVHEIGHFFGLSHNFAATAAGDLKNPSLSAMAYLPFPIAHRMTKLGTLDKTLLHLIYKQERPDSEIPFCSTADALLPYGRQGEYYKPYPCDVRTIGSKADWYVQLAEVSPIGVLTPYPDIRDLPEEIKIRYQMLEDAGYPPRNILTHLGYALAKQSGIPKADRAKIEAYLCDQKANLQRIKDQLIEHHQVVLICKAW